MSVDKTLSVHRFIGKVALLLIPSFVLWMAVSPLLAAPAVWVCNELFVAWMPDIVAAVQLQGPHSTLLTNFGEFEGRIVSDEVAGYQMGYPVDVRTLSYSIPFYAALVFATPQEDKLSKFGWGLWAIYPFVIFGLICVCLKDLMVGLGGVFFGQTVFVPNPHAIGLLYQMSILIIPPLIPVLVWAWQSKDIPLITQFFGEAGADAKTEPEDMPAPKNSFRNG